MPPVGFEPTILTSELPQTYFLDRAAVGRGREECYRLMSSFDTWNYVNYLCTCWG